MLAISFRFERNMLEQRATTRKKREHGAVGYFRTIVRPLDAGLTVFGTGSVSPGKP